MPKKARSPAEIRFEEYVREKLRAELKKRGAKAEIARRLHVSTAHITNVTENGRGIGEGLRRKCAAYWGLTYAELEAEAMGRVVLDPPIGTLVHKIDKLPGLRDEIEARPGRRTSVIARAVSAKYDSPDGVPRDGWRKVLDDLESGAADQIVGSGAKAVAIGKERVGKRRPLPA